MPYGSRATAGVNTTANQQKYRGRGVDAPAKSVSQRCREFLRRMLADGPVGTMQLKMKGAQEGLAWASIQQAKYDIGALSTVLDKKPAWCLKEEDAAPVVSLQERVKPGEDEFSLTPEERKQFGIGDNEEIGWIRDDRYWGNKVPGNRARQFLKENPGGRLVYHEGELITNGVDLVLTARPMAEVEKLRARDAAIEREYYRMQDQEQRDDDEFNPQDKDALIRRKRQNQEQFRRSGMIGPNSPSSGLAYEDYIRYRGLTLDDIKREERSYALGPFADRELSGEAAEAAIADARRQRASEAPRDAGGRFYSLPPTVRPRNLAAKP